MLPRIESIESKGSRLPRWCAVLGGLAIATAAIAAHAAPASSATVYRVINLGPGDTGVAMNAKGQVALTHADPWDPPWRAWFYDGTKLHEIPKLGGNAIRTTGVNDGGQVTGIADTPAGLIHSFVWSKQRGTADIGTLPGYKTSWEPVINNRGEIAGYVDAGGNAPWPHAFRWSAATGMEDLGLLVPGPDSSAYARAINDSGMIAGDAWAGGHTYHAFAWTRSGGMIDIDTINSRRSSPVAVGAQGQVAGNLLNDPNNYGSTFFWTAATGMRDLGTGNGQGSGMFGMSSGGRIAGIISYVNAFEHAMTWTQEHGMRDLGTLGGIRSSALAANNMGQVVGAAVTREDVYHAFVWSYKEGMTDLNKRLLRAPPGLELYSAVGIADNGSIVAASNAGLLLLKPVCGCSAGGGGFVAGPITMPRDSLLVGETLDAAISFLTDNNGGHYNVTWSWGDGTSDRPVAAVIKNGTGSSSARHVYADAGFYTVSATVADAAGKTTTVTRHAYVDLPYGGMVGGAGALLAQASPGQSWSGAGGLAQFSFTAPRAGNATVAKAAASANANAAGRLFFSLGGRAFRSNDLHVVSTEGTRATLAGTGTLNGTGNYSFSLTATAGTGTAGSFGLKIWHTDPKTLSEVVDFDSQNARNGAAALVDGRIMLH